MTGDPYCEKHGFTLCRCMDLKRMNILHHEGDECSCDTCYAIKRYLEKDKTNMMNMTAELEHDSLEYKDSIVEKLQEAIEEYMEFSTTRDLLKLVGNVLGD